VQPVAGLPDEAAAAGVALAILNRGETLAELAEALA
jgi:hypothetical protein